MFQTRKYFISSLALLIVCSVDVALARGVPSDSVSQVRQEYSNVIIANDLSKKVITTTDFLEDPGIYNVYATAAEEDAGLPTQRWYLSLYDGDEPSFSVGAHGGQFLNTFSSYKPCPSCFVANEYWKMQLGEANNTRIMFMSMFTDLCLTNVQEEPYLRKVYCNGDDPRQRWNIIGL